MKALQKSFDSLEQVGEKVRKIVQKIYFKGRGAKTRTFESTDTLSEKLGLDSLEIIEVVVQIEKTFGITIRDEELEAAHLRTIGSLISWVESMVSEGNR